MAKARERRQKRTGARRRAEQHATGFENTVLKVPEGLGFWSPKVGTHKIDIVPFKAGKGNPWAESGDDYYERTYFSYRRIGAEEKNYVAPGKTFGHPDPIAEFVAKAANREDVDPKYLKSLSPKERQLFLVWDHSEPEKGVKIWDISFHLFGRVLDSRINNSDDDDNWDQFDDPTEHGFTLKLTIEQKSAGGYNFNETSAIDFIQRKKALPDNIRNHGICLDDLLVEIPYDKLKAIFVGSVDGEPIEENVPQKEKPEPTAEATEPEERAEPDDPTAKVLGLSVDDEGTYEGIKCRIVKISGDGTSLLLMDENDDVHKAIAPRDFKINRRDTVPAQDEPRAQHAEDTIGDILDPSGPEDDLDEDWG